VEPDEQNNKVMMVPFSMKEDIGAAMDLPLTAVFKIRDRNSGVLMKEYWQS
jgi:hypothetical protein